MQYPEHPGQHLDEGLVHAWLDGQLPPNAAAAVEAHASGCAACAELVAEARGLVAGATRILGALDEPVGGAGAPGFELRAPGRVSSPARVEAQRSRPGASRVRRWAVPSTIAATLLVGALSLLNERTVRDGSVLLSKGEPNVAAGAASSAERADESAAARAPVAPPAPPLADAAPPAARKAAPSEQTTVAAAAPAPAATLAAPTAQRAAAPLDTAAARAAATGAIAAARRDSVASEQGAALRASAVTEGRRAADFSGRGVAGGMAKGVVGRPDSHAVPATDRGGAAVGCYVVVQGDGAVPRAFVLDTTASGPTSGYVMNHVREGAVSGAGAIVGSWVRRPEGAAQISFRWREGARGGTLAPPPVGGTARLAIATAAAAPSPDERRADRLRAAPAADTVVLRRVECRP